MGFYGLVGNEQLFGDLSIAKALNNITKNFDFTRCG